MQISYEHHNIITSNLRRKLRPHLIRNSLLIPDEIHTLMANSRLSPALESGSLLQQRRQLGTNKPMLRLAEVQDPKQE